MYTLEHELQEQAFINAGLPTNHSLAADAFGRSWHTASGCDTSGGAEWLLTGLWWLLSWAFLLAGAVCG